MFHVGHLLVAPLTVSAAVPHAGLVPARRVTTTRDRVFHTNYTLSPRFAAIRRRRNHNLRICAAPARPARLARELPMLMPAGGIR
ncbi:unnamed protein product [Acidocella sp. C78]|nr:unnamed protein product [Acidocella sp. C78]